ncbi:MAG: L-fucose isomerase [Paenibacillus sp.]|nr:L-fucose isomerase [Paenibacillus sp.]
MEVPQEVHRILDERTNSIWPTTWFVPNLTGEGVFRDVYSFMSAWGSNHCAVSYGHVGDKHIMLAAMLRIPVSMHNVAEEHIFRPSVWMAFSTEDLEAADYRACTQLGPLYK